MNRPQDVRATEPIDDDPDGAQIHERASGPFAHSHRLAASLTHQAHHVPKLPVVETLDTEDPNDLARKISVGGGLRLPTLARRSV